MERFPERFRFQLTKEEMAELVANCDRFNSLKHSTVRSNVHYVGSIKDPNGGYGYPMIKDYSDFLKGQQKLKNKWDLYFVFFLSVIGLVSFGETSKKLENGIYHNETSSKLIEIKNDTLKFYSSSSIKGEQSFPLAICQITKVSDTFFEINSIEGPMQSAFKNILIIEEVSGNKTLAEILFKVPNTTMPIKFNVYCGTISYSGITEKGTCTIVLNRNRINSPKSFRFTFQPMYYTESNPAGQYFGVLYYEYPYKVDLNTEKSIIINLPDVTDKLFNQYYLLGEYIQVTPNGIKWRGEYYKKQQ